MITPEEAGRTGGHDEPPDELTTLTVWAIVDVLAPTANDGHRSRITFNEGLAILSALENYFNERRKEHA